MEKALEYHQLTQEVTGFIHISFSEFDKYKRCGHKHLLEKYLKLVEDTPSIHLYFGNAIHKAIEFGLKFPDEYPLEKRIELFREEFYKEMHDNLSNDPSFGELNNFLDQGEHILKILSTEAILKKYDVVGVEYQLYEPLYGQFYFKGFIDLIVRDKKTGRYVIFDWKTSGQEWDVNKKKKDNIFMAQMRLYKYFFAKKSGVPFEEIDCKYVVLNRLINKNEPNGGYGQLQPVEIFSTYQDIESSLTNLAEAMRKIHIEHYFPKAKLIGEGKNCFFCPYKNNFAMCNNDIKQYEALLMEHLQK